MNPIEQRTLDILNKSAEIIRQLPNSAYWIDEINQLKHNVDKKCTLAVGGRVKAGKSTFINTLLGEQLALVGTSETTATVNRFVYGYPADPTKPVKVVYKNGNVSYENQAFMDSFQGNSAKTMALSKGISYFEIALENPILLDVDLVDTPGTDAVVAEHEKAAQEVFGPESKELRKEHDKQTKKIVQTADAVIYLVGAVANASNKKFLDDFQHTCNDSSAINAVGVISRIDEEEATLYNSQSQADYVARSLKDQLSGVMPVSACLYETIKKHSHQFAQWQQMIRSIPQDLFEKYLCRTQDAWEGKYDTILLKQCPDLISKDLRQQMKADISWGVFRAIIKILYETNSPQEAEQKLLKLSNFDEVKRVLQEQFFARAKSIKCTKQLNQLKKILLQIRNDSLYTLKRSARKSEEWKVLINKHIKPNNVDAASELLAFVESSIKSEKEIDAIEYAVYNDLIRPVEQLLLDIETTNMDYNMLQKLQKLKDRFGEYYEELCEIFGMYGVKPQLTNEQKMNRQMFWQTKSMRYMDKDMQDIAIYAASVYGKM